MPAMNTLFAAPVAAAGLAAWVGFGGTPAEPLYDAPVMAADSAVVSPEAADDLRQLGRVIDVLRGDGGRALEVTVEVGGLLGFGAQQVVIDASQLVRLDGPDGGHVLVLPMVPGARVADLSVRG